MPKITAVSTAVPPYALEQEDAKKFVSQLFESRLDDLNRLLPIFDSTRIKTRYFSVPHEWFSVEHTLDEKNEIYIRSATELGAKASRQLFERTNTSPDEIDYILYINTTGLATPSIDARLINKLELRRNIRRTPVWGLGCAGGAAGLATAYHYLVGHPEDKVLVVCAEMCGLTFIPDDFSKSNLVATALFGEGAAAVLITGDNIAGDGLEIVATQSTFYPDSLDVMGWNIVSRGMQVVFDKKIPGIVAEHGNTELTSFLSRHNLTKDDITQYLYHPGGIKVVDAYLKAYGLDDSRFDISRSILNDYGNMSSVTVLFVLERYLQQHGYNNNGYGVISALGPGFCSESLLVNL